NITTVVCRHEQNAAFIAGGIGRMTGKAGIALVTSGPGVSNLATGLVTANSEGDPLVALGGAVAVADRLKSLHQTLDAVSLCKPITKYSAEVDSPAATAEVLSAAFRAAESDRPGAAFVSLPIDVMTSAAKCKLNPTVHAGCARACCEAFPFRSRASYRFREIAGDPPRTYGEQAKIQRCHSQSPQHNDISGCWNFSSCGSNLARGISILRWPRWADSQSTCRCAPGLRRSDHNYRLRRSRVLALELEQRQEPTNRSYRCCSRQHRK